LQKQMLKRWLRLSGIGRKNVLSSNNFVISYIIKQGLNENKSRLQIDAELLTSGYTPQHIDKAWHSLLNTSPKQAFTLSTKAKSKMFIILYLLGLFATISIILADPFPLEPFPQYPDSIPLTVHDLTPLATVLKASGDSYVYDYAYYMQPSDRHFQFFETNDSTAAILDFYEKAAQQAHLVTLTPLPREPFDINPYQTYIFGRSRNDLFPAQNVIMIQILDHSNDLRNTALASLVAHPAPDTKIIIVMTGFAQADSVS
jgi:hypothetical protein